MDCAWLTLTAFQCFSEREVSFLACPCPGYVQEPLDSFAYFRADGDGAYGSRANVTLQVGGLCDGLCGTSANVPRFLNGMVPHSCIAVLQTRQPSEQHVGAPTPPQPAGLHDCVPDS